MLPLVPVALLLRGELTDKQRRFVDEYLIDLNATQAAIRAGYSERTARSIAQENLTKPDIVAYLGERRKLISERTAITPEAVVQRWWDLPRARQGIQCAGIQRGIHGNAGSHRRGSQQGSHGNFGYQAAVTRPVTTEGRSCQGMVASLVATETGGTQEAGTQLSTHG